MLETSNTFRVGKCFTKSFPCKPLLTAQLAHMADALKRIASVCTPKAGKQGWQPAVLWALHLRRTEAVSWLTTSQQHSESTRLGFCSDQQAASLHIFFHKGSVFKDKLTPHNMHINNTQWKLLTCQILANLVAQQFMGWKGFGVPANDTSLPFHYELQCLVWAFHQTDRFLSEARQAHIIDANNFIPSQ